jgi:selenium-binding protein 1
MVKLDTAPKGGMTLDPRFMVEMEEGLRPHQVRLQGGDASSDSFCFPS